MAEIYPSHPNLNENYAPLRMECEVNDLIIEGEIPQDLYGSFYRNGPDHYDKNFRKDLEVFLPQ